MRILFCNIAWMDYYKGNTDGKDNPYNGGSYVHRTGDAHEKYNFDSVELSFDDGRQGEFCLGFVETKSKTGEKVNQLHIERLEGCELMKNEEQVEDVLVIYCASHPAHNFTTVVGWYQHATVYRHYQPYDFASSDPGEEVYTQWYNAIARKEDCVLLPRSARARKVEWEVPRTAKGASYGFGTSNVWFADSKENNQYLSNFMKKIVEKIENYRGENWIDEGRR